MDLQDRAALKYDLRLYPARVLVVALVPSDASHFKTRSRRFLHHRACDLHSRFVPNQRSHRLHPSCTALSGACVDICVAGVPEVRSCFLHCHVRRSTNRTRHRMEIVIAHPRRDEEVLANGHRSWPCGRFNLGDVEGGRRADLAEL
jgi:hypothetical protein